MNPLKLIKWLLLHFLSIALSAQEPHLYEDGDEYFFSLIEYEADDWIEEWESADALKQAFFALSPADLRGLPPVFASLRRRGQRQRAWNAVYRQPQQHWCIERDGICLLLRWDMDYERRCLVVEVLANQPNIPDALVFLKKIPMNKRF